MSHAKAQSRKKPKLLAALRLGVRIFSLRHDLVTAVDNERLADDIAGGIGTQEPHQLCYFGRG